MFKQGDRAYLNVVQVKKAGFVGIPGEMTISNGKVFDINGEEHSIEYNSHITGEEKTWPKVMLGCGLFIILAPLALFGFVKGGQAEINQLIPIDVTTSGDFEFAPKL